MKKLYLAFIFQLPFILISQSELFSKSSWHSIGINALTKDSIYAKDIAFSYELNNFEVDPGKNTLLLSFLENNYEGASSNSDIISAYNYLDDKFLWKQLNKKNSIQFNFTEDKIYRYFKGVSGPWDMVSNKLKWEINSPLYMCNELNKRGIFLAPYFKSDERSFAAISKENGKVLWENKYLIVTGNTILEPFFIDSFMFFGNENLVVINLNSGQFYKYNHTLNYFESDQSGLLPITILGGLVGAVIYLSINEATAKAKTQSNSHFEPHHSNFLSRDSFVFFGSREFIHKYSKKGIEIADKLHINYRNVGISKLFSWQNKLLFLNFGYTILNGERVNASCSKFFIEKFDDSLNIIDSVDYRELKGSLLDGIKGEVIDYKINSDTLLVIFENGFVYFDTALHVLKKIPKNDKNIWVSTVDENFYYLKDSNYYFTDITEGNDVFLTHRNGMVSHYSFNGEIKNNISANDVFFELCRDKNVKFVGNTRTDLILNSKNQPIIETAGITKVKKIENDFIVGFRSGFFIINENQLVK